MYTALLQLVTAWRVAPSPLQERFQRLEACSVGHLCATCPSPGTQGFKVQSLARPPTCLQCAGSWCVMFAPSAISFPRAGLQLPRRPCLHTDQSRVTINLALPRFCIFSLCAAGTLPGSWGWRTNLVHIDVSETAWAYGSNTWLSPTWPGWSTLGNLRYLDMSRPAVLPPAAVYTGQVVNGEGPSTSACQQEPACHRCLSACNPVCRRVLHILQRDCGCMYCYHHVTQACIWTSCCLLFTVCVRVHCVCMSAVSLVASMPWPTSMNSLTTFRCSACNWRGEAIAASTFQAAGTAGTWAALRHVDVSSNTFSTAAAGATFMANLANARLESLNVSVTNQM